MKSAAERRSRKTHRLSPARCRGSRRPESGFAYFMALLMMSVLLIGSAVVLANAATEGKREREEQMILRGNECVRAIRLYYRKTGHYPQTIDDLEKGIPDVHFLRYFAYKDPMNEDDGSWRFIYVNAAGAIVGSVKYANLQQMAILDLNHGQWPAPPSGSDSDSGSSAGPGAPQQPAASGQFIRGPGDGGTQGSTPQAGASGLPSGPALAALGQLKPTGPVDGPVIGGFLTGVASKIDKPSLKVYDGGTRYNQWEFIWNPIEDQMRALQAAQNQRGGGSIGSVGTPSSGQQPGLGGMNFNFQLNGAPGGTPAGPPPSPMPVGGAAPTVPH